MKNVEIIIAENLELIPELEIYIIWEKQHSGDIVALFKGTKEECEEEVINNEIDNHPDFSIEVNRVVDQWENEVDGRGYLKFATGNLISYNL